MLYFTFCGAPRSTLCRPPVLIGVGSSPAMKSISKLLAFSEYSRETPSNCKRTAARKKTNQGHPLIKHSANASYFHKTKISTSLIREKIMPAIMSVFGFLSVVKACVAAGTPDWLRETLGVRSSKIDAEVGLKLGLDTTGMKSKSPHRRRRWYCI